VVLGGGPIGCELSQSFARLGSHVTQVEMGARIMVREDAEVSANSPKPRWRPTVCKSSPATKALRCELVDGEKTLVVEHKGAEEAHRV
jgi:pyruvate/2-oxoglutarate dehydrogenase complex dihydrolipoamide dehydrogenase (E3) component